MASSSATPATPADPKWRSTITRKFARMQYRRDETADWEDLGDVWWKRPKGDAHPERWNVQMVAIGTTGIEVRQYAKIYSRQVDTKQVKQANYGWKVFFPLSALNQIHLAEYERESWVENADPGAKRSIYVIRFKCVTGATGSDASEIPKAQVMEADAMEVDTKPATEVRKDPTQPDKYPLAVMCPEFEGMFIRLAFDKGSTSAKGLAAAARPEVWVWPMIATVLTGRPWRIVESDDNNMPLNEWARAKGNDLGSGNLWEVRSGGTVEWRLHSTKAARSGKPQAEHALPARPEPSAYGLHSTYEPRRYERPTEFPAPPTYDTTIPRGPPAFGQPLPAFTQPPLAPGQAPPRPPTQTLGKRSRETASIAELEAMRVEALERSAQTYRTITDLQKVVRQAKEEDRKARAEVLSLERELRFRRGEE